MFIHPDAQEIIALQNELDIKKGRLYSNIANAIADRRALKPNELDANAIESWLVLCIWDVDLIRYIKERLKTEGIYG